MKTKSIVTLGGAAAALAALFLTACSGGGGNAPAPRAPAASPAVVSAASGTVAVPYASGLLAGAQYAGPASFATRTIDVVTNPADESALYAYAAAVNDPASPVFHQFLTPQQIADRFGPTASQYAAAQAYFAGFGLATHGYAQRSEIAVTGTQAQLQAALGATFGLYKSAGTTFVALASAPHLPASLHVSAVRNAVDLETQMYVLPNPEGASTSLAQSLKPQQVQRAFDFTGAYAAGFSGSGVTVAVLGTGQTTPADVTALSARYGVPAAPLVYVPIASASAPPTSSPLSYATANGCMDNDNFAVTPPCIADGGEARIDTQTVAMLAPAATMLYYLGYSSNGPDSIAELNQIASDNLADVVSMSVGSCEPTSGTPGLEPAIATLAAAGVAMFASVGDNAVWPNSSPCRNNYAQGVIYPSTDPNVVAVGAVYLPVDAAGDLTGQIVPWGFQDTNGNSYRNSAGSGGGYWDSSPRLRTRASSPRRSTTGGAWCPTS